MDESEHLRRKIASLKSQNALQKETLAQKDARITALKRALRALTADEPMESWKYEDPFDEEGSLSDEYGSHGEDECAISMPDAIWDEADQVYRCSGCIYEVLEGTCQSPQCGLKHSWGEEELEKTQGSFSIQNEALVHERCLIERGTTPLLEISNPPVLKKYTKDYLRADRTQEYLTLLRRGATPLMCETFHLEFSPETGIVAWADGDIYDTFSGPEMKPGDFWKIQLGRCIRLDEGDFDGSQFLEDLLEEVLLYPMRSTFSSRTNERWETVEDTPGIWVTRPMGDPAQLKFEDEDDSNEPDNNHSDASALWDELQKVVSDQDQALEDHFLPVDRGPVLSLTMDHYEQSDRDDDSSGDMGWSFHSRRPDAVFLSDEEGDAMDVDNSAQAGCEVDINVDDTVDQLCNSDDAGSDFDSDEILSGDEMVLNTVVT